MPVRTISFRLGMLVVMVAAPLLVLAMGLLLWSAGLTWYTVDRALREAARVLAISVEQEIAVSASALYALAATPRPECEPSPRFYQQASTVAARYGGWVMLADANGRQRMNTLRPLGEGLPKAPATPPAPDSASVERPFMSDTVVSELTARPMLYIAAPVARAGDEVCWLSMNFGPERFESRLQPPGGRSSWSAILTDGRDLLILPAGDGAAPGTPAPPWYATAIEGKQNGLVSGEWFEQGPVRIAFQKVNNGRWTVAVAAPRGEYYFAWVAPVAWGALGSLLVIGIAVSVAGGYARRMKLEVDRLVAQAATLGKGPAAGAAPRVTVAELATLEKALKRADVDIREGRAEHERRVAADASRTAAESASRSKDLFLATLSHELRGPLTAVIGWLDVARDALDDRSLLRRALDTASRNARQQARIIEDLLDISRIVSGKFSVERRPMDLGRLAGEAAEASRLSAAEKGIELRCAVRPNAWVLGDRQRLHQALGNLIGNAIKFNRPGGWVQLTLEPRGNNFRLVVADSGTGISRDALPHIFERFWQAPIAIRGHGGLGLGLPLVRYIVRYHQGRIWAESGGLGRGARFIVELPALPASRATGQATEHAYSSEPGDSRLAGVAVLAVDEDDDTLGWLQTVLARHGATVWCAGSAAEALRLVHGVRPDVLVSELALRGQDGYWLVRQMRERNGGRTGAVALSGEAGPEARERALAEGYDAFVAKPCETGALLGTLTAVAAKHPRRRRAR